jgi:hypothetical protein
MIILKYRYVKSILYNTYTIYYIEWLAIKNSHDICFYEQYDYQELKKKKSLNQNKVLKIT